MPSPISQLSSDHWVESGPNGSPIYTMFVTESWPSSPERRNLVFPQAPIRLCLSQPISPRPTPHCLIRACVWASLPRREAPPLTPLFSLGRWVFLRSWRRVPGHPPPCFPPGPRCFSEARPVRSSLIRPPSLSRLLRPRPRHPPLSPARVQLATVIRFRCSPTSVGYRMLRLRLQLAHRALACFARSFVSLTVLMLLVLTNRSRRTGLFFRGLPGRKLLSEHSMRVLINPYRFWPPATNRLPPPGCAGEGFVGGRVGGGGDKAPRSGPPGHDPNPALGVRGYRTSWARPEVLDLQLTAIAAAAAAERADVWVMAPMIDTVAEAIEFARRARGQGVSTVGVMIETPAAALMSRELLDVVDFASLGTNDLTQYT